jgi:hypothetical protein
MVVKEEGNITEPRCVLLNTSEPMVSNEGGKTMAVRVVLLHASLPMLCNMLGKEMFASIFLFANAPSSICVMVVELRSIEYGEVTDSEYEILNTAYSIVLIARPAGNKIVLNCTHSWNPSCPMVVNEDGKATEPREALFRNAFDPIVCNLLLPSNVSVERFVQFENALLPIDEIEERIVISPRLLASAKQKELIWETGANVVRSTDDSS